MTAAEKLVLLVQDDKTATLAIIPAAAASGPAAETTFRIVVEQRYRYRCGGAGGGDDDDEVDTMEDVACRVPVGELRAATAAAAAAVDRAFEGLMASLAHPTLRPEIAPAAWDAAARVRARIAEEGAGDQLGGAEFRLRVEFVDSLEPEDEETGSDLELDEESWESGWSKSNGGGDCWYDDRDPTALISDDDEDGGAQFSARKYDGGALARDGGPRGDDVDGRLLLSGFEASADGPELADQHDLTSRDVQRLVHLAFGGGDVEGDGAYQRALDGGAPVSRVARAVMLDQALRSTTARQQQRQQPTSPRGMPPRMRTGL